MRTSKQIDRLIKFNPQMFAMYLHEGDAYEVLLNEGYQYNGVHAIAGRTVNEVLEQVNDIERCPSDCVCWTWK
jgi:hypothetical protein